MELEGSVVHVNRSNQSKGGDAQIWFPRSNNYVYGVISRCREACFQVLAGWIIIVAMVIHEKGGSME